jgi:hypothetical protein
MLLTAIGTLDEVLDAEILWCSRIIAVISGVHSVRPARERRLPR